MILVLFTCFSLYTCVTPQLGDIVGTIIPTGILDIVGKVNILDQMLLLGQKKGSIDTCYFTVEWVLDII